MYESDYQLTRRPFAATPDPSGFFCCETNQGVLDTLVICLERGQGIGVLTGGAGIGKTMLCRRVLSELSGKFEPVFISNSNLATPRALLQAILFELGIEYSRKDDQELRLDLRQHLEQLAGEKQGIVLVIDEAHLVPDELLEEVRLLADLSRADLPLVRVLISGQMRLEERLIERAFEALNQRIGAHVTLEALTQAESIEYIGHRLTWAGAEPLSLFTQQALRNVARASGGIPRCIHQLADHALMLAYSRNERPVEVATIHEALQHLKSLPLQWNDLTELSSFQSAEETDETCDSFSSIGDHIADADEALRLAAEFELEFEPEPVSEDDEHTEALGEVVDLPARRSNGHSQTGQAETVSFEFGAETESSTETVRPTNYEPVLGGSVDETVDESVSGLALPEFAATGEDEAPHSPPVVASDISRPLVQRPRESLNGSTVTEAESDGLCITIAPRRRDRLNVVTHTEDDVVSTDVVATDNGRAVPASASHGLTAAPCSAIETACAPSSHDAAPAHSQQSFDQTLDQTSESASPIGPLSMTESKTFQSAPQKDLAVVHFEEEVVIDHYSALQEPEFSGVIWNLASKTARLRMPAKSMYQERVEEPDDEPSSTVPFTQRAAAESRSECNSFGCESASQTVAEHPKCNPSGRQQSHASDLSAENVVAADDSDSDMSDELRPFAPERYLDSIVPMIHELTADDGLETAQQGGRPREIEDVEAEMFDAISFEDQQQEDLIGTEVLDLVFETQAALRKSQSAIARSLQKHLEELAEEPEDDVSDESFGVTRFDVVQPDFDRPSLPTKPISESRTASSSHSPVQPNEPQKRPYGQLFSDLRKKQRKVS